MTSGITSIDPDFTSKEVQELVCAGCGTIGSSIEAKWSDEIDDESMAGGSEETLVCECGSSAYFVTRRRVEIKNTDTKETTR
jgi:hypothetical protein